MKPTTLKAALKEIARLNEIIDNQRHTSAMLDDQHRKDVQAKYNAYKNADTARKRLAAMLVHIVETAHVSNFDHITG